MVTSKRKLVILSILVILIGFSSCKSNKDINKDYYTNSDDIYIEAPTDYKNTLGFKLNHKDNEFLYKEVSRWIGVKYRYGGNNLSGTDCSGMVLEIYKKVYGKNLSRNSSQMMEDNCKKIKKTKLKEGDLVFFATGKSRKKISHVGLYLKDNKFVHASVSRGVIISDLEDNYYKKNFVCAGKVK